MWIKKKPTAESWKAPEEGLDKDLADIMTKDRTHSVQSGHCGVASFNRATIDCKIRGK